MRSNFLSDLDAYVNAAGEFELHQRVHCLGGASVDVDQTLEAAELELLAGFLVDKVERLTVKMRLWVGRGIGPFTTAPVAFTVFTIFSADLSTRL